MYLYIPGTCLLCQNFSIQSNMIFNLFFCSCIKTLIKNMLITFVICFNCLMSYIIIFISCNLYEKLDIKIKSCNCICKKQNV